MSTDNQETAGNEAESGGPSCPHCREDVDAGRHFSVDSLGRPHCSTTGRVVSQEWRDSHPEVELPEPEPDAGEPPTPTREGSHDDGPSTGGPPSAALNPLRRALEQYGLADHVAGEAALRERRRQGGNLDPATVDQILITGDVNAGRRRLCIREYSQLIGAGNDPGPGAAPGRTDRGESGGVTELVSALDQLDRVRDRGGQSNEVLAEALQTMAAELKQGQAMLAEALRDDDTPSEIERLEERLEELQQDRRDAELEALHAEIHELRENQGYAVEGDRLPEDHRTAEAYLQHKSAQHGLDQFARKLPPGDELLKELRRLGQELSHFNKYGRVPPGHNVPDLGAEGPVESIQPEYGPPGYTPPEEREGAAAPNGGAPPSEDSDEVAALWNQMAGEGEPEPESEPEGVGVAEALDPSRTG